MYRNWMVLRESAALFLDLARSKRKNMKRLLMYIVVLMFLTFWLVLSAGNQSKTQAARRSTEDVTFSNQIVRLMQNHCQRCHHPDGAAPFSLMTYEEAYPYARAIRSAVQTRRMPHGVFNARLENGCGDVNTFEGPRRLLDSEIAMFAAWVEADAPEGNPADMPPPMTFDNDPGHGGHDEYYDTWQAGEPDIELNNGPDGFKVPGSLYKDFFRRFPIKTNYESDRYFTSFEVLPGTGDLGRQINVVHHVTLFIDPTCGSLEQEKAFAASNPEIKGAGFEGEFLYETSLVGMWFPGTNAIVLPAGIGIKIPRGACLIMEIHYTTWQPEEVVDKTTMGLRWARTPVYYERLAKRVSNENFVIPAGAKHYMIKASKTIDDPVTIYSMAPHMHQFGTDFVADALLPDGQKKCLIDVEYDFKHQGNYLLKEPIHLPAGTQITIRGYYDNTEDFPRQLNHPPINIPFGPVSDKEMCQITIGLTNDTQLLQPSSPTLSTIRVNGDSLIVNGSDLRPGAFIEVNGKLLTDTQMGDKQSSVFSLSDWHEFADASSCCCAAKGATVCNCGKECSLGKPVKIAIVNPDGGRSATRRFLLRDLRKEPSRIQY